MRNSPQITKSFFIMTENEKKEPSDKPKWNPSGCLILLAIAAFVLAMFWRLKACVDGASDDDVWGHVQHSVDTDPYYDQWD